MDDYLRAKGELLPYERYTLHNWIKKIIPLCILEVGTGNGGATSSMAAAIKEARFPTIIYTCDPYGEPSSDFFERYPFVAHYAIGSDILIMSIIRRKIDVDFIMFDGPDDPEIALRDILELEKHIKSGTHFCMHDWEIIKRGYDGAISTKAKEIRPYMEKSEKWTAVEILSGLCKNSDYDEMPFDSVGLCLYKFKK